MQWTLNSVYSAVMDDGRNLEEWFALYHRYGESIGYSRGRSFTSIQTVMENAKRKTWQPNWFPRASVLSMMETLQTISGVKAKKIVINVRLAYALLGGKGTLSGWQGRSAKEGDSFLFDLLKEHFQDNNNLGEDVKEEVKRALVQPKNKSDSSVTNEPTGQELGDSTDHEPKTSKWKRLKRYESSDRGSGSSSGEGSDTESDDESSSGSGGPISDSNGGCEGQNEGSSGSGAPISNSNGGCEGQNLSDRVAILATGPRVVTAEVVSVDLSLTESGKGSFFSMLINCAWPSGPDYLKMVDYIEGRTEECPENLKEAIQTFELVKDRSPWLYVATTACKLMQKSVVDFWIFLLKIAKDHKETLISIPEQMCRSLLKIGEIQKLNLSLTLQCVKVSRLVFEDSGEESRGRVLPLLDIIEEIVRSLITTRKKVDQELAASRVRLLS